jgi:hypothetical protein
MAVRQISWLRLHATHVFMQCRYRAALDTDAFPVQAKKAGEDKNRAQHGENYERPQKQPRVPIIHDCLFPNNDSEDNA